MKLKQLSLQEKLEIAIIRKRYKESPEILSVLIQQTMKLYTELRRDVVRENAVSAGIGMYARTIHGFKGDICN